MAMNLQSIMFLAIARGLGGQCQSRGPYHRNRWRCAGLILGALASIVISSCAARRSYISSPVPGWELVRDVSLEPPEELSVNDQRAFERAWQAVKQGELESAASELLRLERRSRKHPSIETALGYVELRGGARPRAEVYFQEALDQHPTLAAAQAGYFLTALAEGRDELAFDRLRQLALHHPDHPAVPAYLPSLQLKLAEDSLQSARSLRDEKRYSEAAQAYRRALEIAPEAAGLYAETATVELLGGEAERAAQHADKAIEMRPDDADLYRIRADAHREMGELQAAAEDYRRASQLRPRDDALRARYEAVRRELERAHLPEEYGEIPSSPRLTREQLAALLFVKLRPAFEQQAGPGSVIATDIGDSWADHYIRQVVASGLMDIFPNHTFQPQAFVRRSDLAKALAAAVEALGEPVTGSSTRTIADMPADNLNYPAVALVVSLGLLSLDDMGQFEPHRFVTGLEAVEAVDSLAERILGQ